MTTTQTVEQRINALTYQLSQLNRHDALKRQQLMLQIHQLQADRDGAQKG